MKKLLPIIIVVILLLAGGAGYYLFAQKSKAPSSSETAKQNTNVFSSIQEALSKSLSLQCNFTDAQNRKTTAYIKAGAVRTDIIGNDPSQQYNTASVIIKDKKMYLWDVVKKQGIMMAVKEEQATTPTGSVQPSPTSSSSSQNAGNVMAMLEKYKQDCKPGVVSDSLFTPPTDVAFQDLSKMMVPTTVMPSGVPTGMNQQDVQKMMQQYQQQAPQTPSGY